MSAQVLAAALGIPDARATVWFPHLYAAMVAYQITSKGRQAAFLAQIGHESGRLRYTTEIWGPTPAQARYEGRVDLGNVQKGDGFRFRGRGLIQITGRANYAHASQRLGVDFVARPDGLAEYKWAALSAADYWGSRNLNALADIGTDDAFVRITRKINGGVNGLPDRRKLWAMAKQAVGA